MNYINEFLYTKEKYDETRKIIINLKIQVEKAKTIEEDLRALLKEKEYVHSSLEFEIVSIRMNFEKSNANIKFEKIYETIDEILNLQSPPSDKIGLGYNKEETVKKESTSSQKLGENKTKSYVIYSRTLWVIGVGGVLLDPGGITIESFSWSLGQDINNQVELLVL